MTNPPSDEKARSIKDIRLRLENWNANAFARYELYDDCEILLKHYDTALRELSEARKLINDLLISYEHCCKRTFGSSDYTDNRSVIVRYARDWLKRTEGAK